MCEKCEELKKKFQETNSITDRQLFWNDYDKQRTECTKNEAK